MNFILSAFLLVGSFTIVCPLLCTPEQWEGIKEGSTGYTDKFSHGLMETYASVHYDYTNKRFALQLSTRQGSKVALYNILTIYKDGKGVRYTSRYYPFSPCVKENLTKPFEEKCVPDGSTPAGSFFFGESGDFLVNSYFAFTEEGTTNYIVSKKDENTMIPVFESVKGTLDKYDIYQTTIFKNITAGIKTENVFNVPAGCPEGKSDKFWLAETGHPSIGHLFSVV